MVEGWAHSVQVVAAQTRLAQDLHRRPELYETYLVELLTLFADKGVAIQNLKIANHQNTVRQFYSLWTIVVNFCIRRTIWSNN